MSPPHIFFFGGLDDADEDLRGLMVVSIHRKSEHFGWQLGEVETATLRLMEGESFNLEQVGIFSKLSFVLFFGGNPKWGFILIFLGGGFWECDSRHLKDLDILDLFWVFFFLGKGELR